MDTRTGLAPLEIDRKRGKISETGNLHWLPSATSPMHWSAVGAAIQEIDAAALLTGRPLL